MSSWAVSCRAVFSCWSGFRHFKCRAGGTIKDSINHLKEIQVFCLTRVAIFLSIPATYSHDRYSILRLRSAIFLHNKFTWCRPSDVGKGRTHPLRRGNGVKSGAGSNTTQGLYHSLFLRSAYFYKYLILGLVWCDAKSEEGLSLWQAVEYVPAARRKQLKDNFQLQAGRAGTELHKGDPSILDEIIMPYKNAIWIFCLPHFKPDWLTNILTNRMRKIYIIIPYF